ncbi:MAG: hypothetical protein IKL22_02270 [Lachnospiraceae bacterium]|nr:hypothetical protein [Lachnospiraceae bacterium]
MSLIICPECSGKVSDKADVCVHCGYPLSPNTEVDSNLSSNNVSTTEIVEEESPSRVSKDDNQESKSNFLNNKKGIIAIIAVVCIAVFLGISMTKSFSFDKFTADMTYNDIHNMMGEPDDCYLINENLFHCRRDYYSSNKYRFCGLDGEVTFEYDTEHALFLYMVEWKFNIPENKSLGDYNKYVEKINAYFTKKYGEHGSSYYEDNTWTDANGDIYTLYTNGSHIIVWKELKQ